MPRKGEVIDGMFLHVLHYSINFKISVIIHLDTERIILLLTKRTFVPTLSQLIGCEAKMVDITDYNALIVSLLSINASLVGVLNYVY